MIVFIVIVLTGTGMFEITIPYTFSVTVSLGTVAEWIGILVQTVLLVVAVVALLPDRPKLSIRVMTGQIVSRAGDGLTKRAAIVTATNTGKVPVRINNISFVRKHRWKRDEVWTALHWTQNATGLLLGGHMDIHSEDGQKTYHDLLEEFSHNNEFDKIEELVKRVQKEHSLPRVLEPGITTEWLIGYDGDVEALLEQNPGRINAVVSSAEKSYYSINKFE